VLARFGVAEAHHQIRGQLHHRAHLGPVGVERRCQVLGVGPPEVGEGATEGAVGQNQHRRARLPGLLGQRRNPPQAERQITAEVSGDRGDPR
jgi:hypothetical protein